MRNGGVDSHHPTPNEVSSTVDVQPAIFQELTYEVIELDRFGGVAGPDVEL